MKNPLLLIVVFVTGVSAGWWANHWLGTIESAQPGNLLTTNTNTPDHRESASDRRNELSTQGPVPRQTDTHSPLSVIDSTPAQSDQFQSNAADAATFEQLLANRRYAEAMNLYQQQKQADTQTAERYKSMILEQLQQLIQARRNSDFSTLMESYLSIYYDDIDALLLLADFNHKNNSYLEVVDVYLLAKTYAYSDFDIQRVDTRLNNFVKEIDSAYTRQSNWWDLINFYTHINASGLMTPTYQYQQALAHLRNGDEAYAIEQFNQLLGDSLVGDSAAQALGTLAVPTEAPAAISTPVPEEATVIDLQKQGNQFLVNLAGDQQNSVRLLIDTGASMTAVSGSSFARLNANGNAVPRERRVFHTAGGVIMGTVYAFPELTLGPYRLKDTQVAVIDLDSDPNIDGLLGMNILGQFRFQIDQQNARLLLSRQ